MGALIPTFRVPSDADITVTLLNANKAYGDLTRGKSGHSFGALDGYLLGALAHSLIEKAPPPTKAALANFVSSVLPASPEIAKAARLLRIEKNFDKKWKRVYVLLDPGYSELQAYIETVIVAAGGHRQFNAAPPSNMERELQAILTASGN